MSSHRSAFDPAAFRRDPREDALKVMGESVRDFRNYLFNPGQRVGIIIFALSLYLIYRLDTYYCPSINWRPLFVLPVLSAGYYLSRRETYLVSVLSALGYTTSYQHQFHNSDFFLNFIPAFVVLAYLAKFSADVAGTLVEYETYRAFAEHRRNCKEEITDPD
jgi:hypothetical protein